MPESYKHYYAKLTLLDFLGKWMPREKLSPETAFERAFDFDGKLLPTIGPVERDERNEDEVIGWFRRYSVRCVCDILLQDKMNLPTVAFEVVHTHPCSGSKLDFLNNRVGVPVIEVSADWILDQTLSPPTKLSHIGYHRNAKTTRGLPNRLRDLL